jgi:hypothetical protein
LDFLKSIFGKIKGSVNQVAQINKLSANLIAQSKVYRLTFSQYAVYGLRKLLRLENTGLLLEMLYRGEQSENNEYEEVVFRKAIVDLILIFTSR